MSDYTPDQLREIDAAIAEHLFGWVWMERYNTPGSSEARKAIYPPEDDPHGWERCNFWEDAFRPAKPDTPKFTDWDRACLKRTTSISVLYTEMPRYSTDVAAAWEVVEKMREVGWWYTVSTCEGQTDTYVRFARRLPGYRGTMEYHGVTHESFFTAVCLAALKAVGHPWAGEVKG